MSHVSGRKLPVSRLTMVDRQECTIQSIPHVVDLPITISTLHHLFNLETCLAFKAHVKFYTISMIVSAQHPTMDIPLALKAFIDLYRTFREFEIGFSLISLSRPDAISRLLGLITISLTVSGSNW